MDARSEADYTEFVTVAWPNLLRTAFLLTGDHQRAEDLVQNACVKVYVGWPRISRMDHPVAYARRIVVNQATSWWRRRSSSEVVSATMPDVAHPGFDEWVTESQVVWAAVLQLPPRQRAVIVLRYYEDLTEAEIADALGVAPGTVKGHAHAAMVTLRRVLDRVESVPVSGESS